MSCIPRIHFCLCGHICHQSALLPFLFSTMNQIGMTNSSVHNSNDKEILLFFSDMLALNIFPINHKTLKTFSELDEGVFK